MSARFCAGAAGARAELAPRLPTSSHEPASEPDSTPSPLACAAAPLRSAALMPLGALGPAIKSLATRRVPVEGGPVQGWLQTHCT